MKKIYLLPLLLALLLFYCKKDETSVKLELKTDAGYVSKDVSVKYMAEVKIGVVVETLPPFNFKVMDNDNLLLDTTILINYLYFDLKFVKNFERNEKISFLVSEGESLIGYLELNVRRDTSLTAIDSFYVGAQLSDTAGFYSIAQKKAYNDSAAFKNQALIDFLYYVAPVLDDPVLASPHADVPSVFREEYNLDKWTTRDTTLFSLSNITTEGFDELKNDSLLITGFDMENTLDKTPLQEDKVYLIKTDAHKYAALKVIDISGGEEGYMQISVKVQK